MRNQIFVVLLACLFASALGDVVYYIPSPDCASPAGCDFNTSTLWTGPLNNQTTLVISSNVSITLRLSSLYIPLQTLIIGEGNSAPVHIVMVHSIFDIPRDNNIATENLSWGNTSTFTLTSSFLSGSIVQGGFISLYNSSILSARFLLVDYITADTSTITGLRSTTIGEAHVYNSLFLTSVTFNYLYSNGSQFMSEVDINNIGVFTDSILSNLLRLMVNNANVSFYNTNLTCTVELNDNATLSFYTDNESELQVPAIGGQQGTVILGDNVVASFQQGYINNLILGNNVNLTLGWYSFTNMFVLNIQNNVGATMASVSITSSVSLASTSPLSATIYIAESRSLTIESNLTLQLAPGNVIYGPGLLSVNGELDCFGSNISVSTVGYQASGLVKVDTLFTSLLAPGFYSLDNNTVRIYGNVVIVTDYNGFDAGAHSFTITGSFTQIGGYINFTINAAPSSTPLVTVGGAIVIQDVTFDTITAIAVKNKDKFLLMRSLQKNLTLENSNVGHSVYTVELSNSITPGDLYITITTKTGENWFTKKRIIIISAVGGGVLACFIVIIAFAVRRSRRHHYSQVK